MKRFQKLSDVQAFFRDMEIPGFPDLSTVMVVSSGDATKHLGGGASGIQVLVAYPEGTQYIDGDSFSDRIGTAVFVLEKDLESARTAELEFRQYETLLEIADSIVAAVDAAISGTGCPSCGCPPLAGVEMESVELVPELSLFGGWNGYSIEFSFK